jgi:hypothetical protein
MNPAPKGRSNISLGFQPQENDPSKTPAPKGRSIQVNYRTNFHVPERNQSHMRKTLAADHAQKVGWIKRSGSTNKL